MYKRSVFYDLIKRFKEPRLFIQVLSGPRQTGKTVLARQVIESLDIPCHYATADEPTLKQTSWIEQQWETARFKVKSSGNSALFILDEVQKIPDWSEVIKRLWDEDSAYGLSLYVMILGSSPLLVQQGLTESLAGRFEIVHVTHWSYSEMKEAFAWDINQYIFFGGYPGSVLLINDKERWANYIKDSIIETTISRDILLMSRVDKPALLRRLFEIGCIYSGQVISYQKILGQLQDAGNTTTLAHYLDLLEGAGLLMGLSKYAGQRVRQRASSPKFQVLNTALLSAQSHLDITELKNKPDIWGRQVESAVGSSLANGIKGRDIQLYYWAERNHEVDFVLQRGTSIVAIEVKSGRKKQDAPGMELFSREFGTAKKLLVGTGGISVEEFISVQPEQLF